jgi:tetratricopeptide (TPR) repeat protein
MTMIRRLAIVVLLLLPALVLRAQDPLVEALRRYQAGDLGLASKLVDEAIAMPAHAKDPEAWLLRGFIRKDQYKATAGTPAGDQARQEGLESLLASMELDKSGTYRDNALQAYDYLVRTCYNEAAKALGEAREERAVSLFEYYKEWTLQLKPGANLRSKETEFLNALGTAYNKRFSEDRSRLEWFGKAVEAYRQVLALDPENYGANYNLATLYYNLGVARIRAIKADDDIPSIQEIQQAAREHFQNALPYMLKAYEMNPQRRETLLGLEGIYYSLQEENNSEKFRRLFEELPPSDER